MIDGNIPDVVFVVAISRVNVLSDRSPHPWLHVVHLSASAMDGFTAAGTPGHSWVIGARQGLTTPTNHRVRGGSFRRSSTFRGMENTATMQKAT